MISAGASLFYSLEGFFRGEESQSCNDRVRIHSLSSHKYNYCYHQKNNERTLYHTDNQFLSLFAKTFFFLFSMIKKNEKESNK